MSVQKPRVGQLLHQTTIVCFLWIVNTFATEPCSIFIVVAFVRKYCRLSAGLALNSANIPCSWEHVFKYNSNNKLLPPSGPNVVSIEEKHYGMSSFRRILDKNARNSGDLDPLL